MTVLLLVVGINVIAFLAFGWDKRRAETRQRRIPERTLLTLAFIGGALGALLGQQIFRHKTQKQPFRALLWLAALANIAIAIAWLTAAG
jgi:uncharacterized membrane protein YsdA (DUF1294 family)